MYRLLMVSASMTISFATLLAQQPDDAGALARIPVQEITVFKDGHAFLMHRGGIEVNEHGNVVLDYLPAPVLGTFWPFSAESGGRLTSVVARRHRVDVERTALTLRALVQANIGARVRIRESTNAEYEARILDVPVRTAEELSRRGDLSQTDVLPQEGAVVLLETESGVKVVNLDRIIDVSFLDDFGRMVEEEVLRGALEMDLDWSGRIPDEAEVGLLYLQKGIRWIPNYRVTINKGGKARVELQATLLNELYDLTDVTAHLVIGVPSFAFQDATDPIALQQTAVQLSEHFRRDSQTAFGFANAIMSQQPSVAFEASRSMQAGDGSDTTSPEIVGSEDNEDLYVFTVDHLSLKKGERMVLPVQTFEMEYRDVYRLDIPFSPPPEVWRNFNSGRQSDMIRMLHAPKVEHKLRIKNTTDVPITTAPALILNGDRLLAQGMIRYAAPGAEADLSVTSAVDIEVKKTDNEVDRVPNAAVWQGDQYGRIGLEGAITLTNYRDEPLDVEIVRHVLGNVDEAGDGGRMEMVNLFEDPSFASGPVAFPSWWGWFSWPWWWHHFNGVGRITWEVTLQPEVPLALGYSWNYYWR